MYIVLKKLRFFIFIVVLSFLGGGSLLAVPCTSISTPIVLDGSYEEVMNKLVNTLSESTNIADRSNFRQSRLLENSEQQCVQINIKLSNELVSPKITIIISQDSLYLQGFITNNGTYYFFADSTIRNIPGRTSIRLATNSDYNDLVGDGAVFLSAKNIKEAVTNLAEYNNPYGENVDNRMKANLVNILFITSDALRFRSIAYVVPKLLNSQETVNYMTYKRSVNAWSELSKQAISQGVNNFGPDVDPNRFIGTKDDIRIAKR